MKRRKNYKKPELKKSRNHGVACVHCRLPEDRCWKTHRRLGEALDTECRKRLDKVAALGQRING